VRRRLVGGALREYRQAHGYALDDAARTLECDRSKVSRIETGQRGIRGLELRALLVEYGVGKDVRDTLMAIAHPPGDGWWQEYVDVLPAGFVEFAVLEAAASRILIYETACVPGLLQTREYASAIFSADAADVRDRRVEAALARQRAVVRSRRAAIAVVIGEGALRQLIGGAAVIRRQSRALALANELPEVSVQVLPFASGVPVGGGSMTVLEFGDAPGLGVVSLGGVAGGVCLTGGEDVAAYRDAFSGVQRAALAGGASAHFLRRMTCG
jgi:transcriptional regulator with XRE-family HTH domain